MAKKSLSEQLALLTQPQNDFDIEDSGLKDNVFEHEDDEGSASEEDDTMKKQHYVNVPRSKLRQQVGVALGKKYSGSVTSRDDLYASDENKDAEDLEDEEAEESDSGASLRANSDEESGSDDEDDSGVDQRNAELEHKRSRVKELMAKERTHIVSRLSNSATNDSLKGFAISQQHKFFDKVIDSRLKIQKSLTNSNLLPPSHDTLVSQKLGTKKTAKNLQKAKEECYNLLDSIFALRNALFKKDQVSDKVFGASKKRSYHEYSSVTAKMDSALDKYRSNVLTKWSAKVQNSSGATAINAGKFKAINQSFEQQVMNNLTDMDRLVKRTKLNRRQIKPLGYDHYKSQFEKEEDDEEDEEDENPDIPKETNTAKSNIAEIDEIFDDEDFYRVLLNDLVDKKIQSSNPTTGLTVSLRSAQQAQKFKKNVDTKASKGRKLRYHIQEPIANFEAPRGSLKWDDNQIDEFFASLLGQKVNMNEDDEVEEDDEEEEVRVEGDSIKLFG
ncbi:TRAUB-domain-containing protein [Suhomyces tanzawaensis NRRL Y-17324]|uniref:Protein BFR2 n=1 Tax=Suhomyces tanzawaensis NRRL Y-17324 TaxID=984487 RepID=A0A1E4SJG1_9ASCO|nr:TRAUB-domain-containing protein [Suhomyces tanzawaensis NRRL Y-17324]ODV79572.1 TRAUB-domain-containing protein [Suhomyces tanzawaensis NRRL Y-17324]